MNEWLLCGLWLLHGIFRTLEKGVKDNDQGLDVNGPLALKDFVSFLYPKDGLCCGVNFKESDIGMSENSCKNGWRLLIDEM